MEFKQGTCPKCQGELQIPEDHDTIICMYCGAKIKTEDALGQAKVDIKTSVKKEMDSASYQEMLKLLDNGLVSMLNEFEKPMSAFNRKGYEDNFKEYCNKYQTVTEAMDTLYDVWDNQELMAKETADRFVDEAQKSLEEIGKKRLAEDKLLDYNMMMVVFVFPALLEQRTASREALAKAIVVSWKEHFPQTNIEVADYEQINSGFKRRFCYITTAVCESLDKPDDCYELNVLRNYRDLYLMQQNEGEELVKKYYDIAPTIVKHIDKCDNRKEIYREVFQQYLSPCIRLIEQDQKEACMKLYQNMVFDLQKKYFA